MGDFTYNKMSKDGRLIKIIRKAIVKFMKLNHYTMEEIAFELGMQLGTLENKLKPSSINEFTITEVEHIMEFTEDSSILEYLSNKHGGAYVKVDNCKRKQ